MKIKKELKMLNKIQKAMNKVPEDMQTEYYLDYYKEIIERLYFIHIENDA